MTADRSPAQSPLPDRTDALARIGAREMPFLAQLSLRIDVREALGPHPFEPPDVPNTWSTLNEREFLWLGPDEWLVLGSPGTQGEITAWLESLLEGHLHSIVEVSANRAVFELTGADRHELLSTGCPLDLHPRSWGPGRCAQTVFGSAQILLQERDEATRVFVRPSFAGYVISLFLNSAPESLR